MSHQEQDDLRTPLQELEGLLQPIRDAELESVQRHGNATLGGFSVAVQALLTFGWSQQKNLTKRFESARDASARLNDVSSMASSRQGLFAALRACSAALLDQIFTVLVTHLQRQSCWEIFGRPTFAVDGSQFAIPRTAKNLQRFAAASRKAKGVYKKAADYSKAKTTQITLSMCLHLGSGLPFRWKSGGSADSERGLLLDLLDRLPERCRLVLDAYYFGYEFWNKLIDRQFTFVVRAGKNIDLLKPLQECGKVKCKGELVLYWPQAVLDAGGDPIILSLVVVMVGRKKMYLLTNELELSDSQLAALYSKRWGIEVFFRTVKQSYQRAKLECRTPDNALIELDWTLLGTWMALTCGGRHIPPNKRMSPIQVMRTIAGVVQDVARNSSLLINLAAELMKCFIADESNRESSKNSQDYPKKKRKRQTGEPTVHEMNEKQKSSAKDWAEKKSLPA